MLEMDELKRQLRRGHDQEYSPPDHFRSQSATNSPYTSRLREKINQVQHDAAQIKQQALSEAKRILEKDQILRQKEREGQKKLEKAKRQTWAHLPRQKMKSESSPFDAFSQFDPNSKRLTKTEMVEKAQKARDQKVEMERTKLMANLEKTQQRLEERKRQQLEDARQRELHAKMKQEQLLQFRRELDKMEESKCLKTLETLQLKRKQGEDRLDNLSKQRQQEHILKKSVEVKLKNQQLEERVKEFNERKAFYDNMKAEELEQKQMKVNRKLKNIFRNLTAEWNERRQFNKEKQVKGFHKKQLEDKITQKKQQELKSRLQRAEEVVQQFKASCLVKIRTRRITKQCCDRSTED